MCSAVRDVLDIAMEAFEKHDLELATRVEPLEEVVDKIRTKLKNRQCKKASDRRVYHRNGLCVLRSAHKFGKSFRPLLKYSGLPYTGKRRKL